ncbi:unnamed protein product [Ectocarpus sp. CCAP 1310/34]|nr:unnamed protein product [Ectocarpus sp. CCAP 1310/34]
MDKLPHPTERIQRTSLTLEEGTVVYVFDFQEQRQLMEQDEVQSQHWQHDSVTIFRCPIYLKWKARMWAYSYQVLSDDRTQDNAWALPPWCELFFTDNCAKQFKCRFHFGWLASYEVMIRDNHGESTNVPVHVEHHYFGSCHGKSVQGPRHLCTLLGESMDFILEEPTEEEEIIFEASRTSSRRGDQLLMTKIIRKFILQAAGDILPAVRSASRSESKAIRVEGCQPICKIVATETPGVVATYTLSCLNFHDGPWSVAPIGVFYLLDLVSMSHFPALLSASCELCRKGETEECNLLREGIMEGPAEWSRRRSNDDEEATKEREMEVILTRMRIPLPYGSVALMPVRPEEYRGQDIVPIFIGRKAPSNYTTSSFEKDGMFSEGDVMVWIHDVLCHVWVIEYDVPNVLPVDEKRIEGGAIAWFSKTQKCVTLSTTQAEYVAMADMGKEILFLRQVWRFMLPKELRPCIPLYEDNEGAIQIAKHPISNSNSKHIDVLHHFLRQLVDEKEVEIIHVASQYQHADFLTKALPERDFVFHRDYVMNLK